jgi:ribonucleoside-diphosphate reductase alpha chain
MKYITEINKKADAINFTLTGNNITDSNRLLTKITNENTLNPQADNIMEIKELAGNLLLIDVVSSFVQREFSSPDSSKVSETPYEIDTSDILYNLPSFYRWMIDNEYYDNKLEDYYDINGTTDRLSILDMAASIIKWERDLTHDYTSLILLLEKYFIKARTEHYIEGLSEYIETPQILFFTLALYFAMSEKKEYRRKKVEEFYWVLSTLKVSLATPMLANLRKPNASLTSCFIDEMGDSLLGIMNTVTNAAEISKNGGGVGINMDAVRPLGGEIKGIKGVAGGVNSFMGLLDNVESAFAPTEISLEVRGGALQHTRLVDRIATAFNQQGRRKGAITVSLAAWHKDILPFIESQLVSGLEHTKCRNIFTQVGIPDLFFKRYLADNKATWTLLDGDEVQKKLGRLFKRAGLSSIRLHEMWGEEFEKAYAICEANLGTPLGTERDKLNHYTQIECRDLLLAIIKSYYESGKPYINFVDTINKYNPNPHIGKIKSTNLCVESFSATKVGELTHCCNLVSLVLSRITTPEELEKCTRIAINLLDNSIELGNPPLPSARKHNELLRTIGLGTLGLADWLAYNSIRYSDIETDKEVGDENTPFIKKWGKGTALSIINKLYDDIAYYSVSESINLAKEKGSYPAYKGSTWSKGHIMSRPLQWYKENSYQYSRWKELGKELDKHGIRNSHLLAIAPNTSSSLIQMCIPSILPPFKKFYSDKSGNGNRPVVPAYLDTKLWFYETKHQISPFTIIKMCQNIQRWTDTGISMELLFNFATQGIENNKQMAYIRDAIIEAWKGESKAVYYVRFEKKEDSDIGNNTVCESCAS